MPENLPPILPIDQVDNSGISFGTPVNQAVTLSSLNLPTPQLLLITPSAPYLFLKHQGLSSQLHALISNLPLNDPPQLNQAASQIHKRLIYQPFPTSLSSQLKSVLKQHLRHPHFYLLPSDDTPLNSRPSTPHIVKGLSVLLDTLRSLWSSYFNPENLLTLQTYPDLLTAIPSILVYDFPLPEVSGVIHTRSAHDKNQTLIKAYPGIAPEFTLDSHSFLPQQFILQTQTGRIIQKQLINQDHFLSLDRFGHLKVLDHKLSKSLPLLSDRDLVSLCQYGRQIQNHLLAPVSILWLKSKHELFLTRIKTTTTIEYTPLKTPTYSPQKLTQNLKLLFKGQGASPGIVSAPARVAKKYNQALQLQAGEILVAPFASHQLIPAMKKAVGIIVNQGGSMSHAAIIARELGIPAIVAAPTATQKIRTGQIITLNGSTGEIYSGGLPHYHIDLPTPHPEPQPHLAPTHTATKLFLNLSSAKAASRWSKLLPDGVGAIRGDLLMVEFGSHPQRLITSRQTEAYLDYLTQTILKISQHLPPIPLFYHAADLTSNQAGLLIGGKDFEVPEANPLLGLHGASRTLLNPAFFELELQAIRSLRQKHRLSQLHLVLPTIRNRSQLHQLKRLCASNGLTRSASFQLYLPLVYPANIFQISDFATEGIDGCFINLNLLIALTLGIDPHHPDLQPLLHQHQPAIPQMLKSALETCHRHHLKSIVSGPYLEKDPSLLKLLIEHGVWSLSLDPLTFNHFKYDVAYHESQLVNQKTL